MFAIARLVCSNFSFASSVSPPAVTTTSAAPFLNTLWIVVALVVGYGVFYLWLWLNRTRFFDLPTIAESAYIHERLLVEQLGEREFSRQLLDFEQMAGNQLEQALRILVSHREARTRQLAYCWLARRGYGHKSMQWVWAQLELWEERRTVALVQTNPVDTIALAEPDFWPLDPAPTPTLGAEEQEQASTEPND